MKHNKLVRDGIPELIKSNGDSPVTHIASESEYWQKLKEKLQEEADEFVKSEKEEELADLLEVFYAICEYKKIDKSELENVRQEKSAKRGSFSKRIILEETK